MSGGRITWKLASNKKQRVRKLQIYTNDNKRTTKLMPALCIILSSCQETDLDYTTATWLMHDSLQVAWMDTLPITRATAIISGAYNSPLWMGDQPPHLTRWSKIHLVWAEHGDMILLFGPAWFKYSIMQLSESPQYWAMCCLHKHTVTLASNNLCLL